MKAVAVAVAAVVMATELRLRRRPNSRPQKPSIRRRSSRACSACTSHELSDPSPQVHQKFGAIRIWDNGVRWDEVNTAPGVYDWTLLDQVVANAEATGAQRIMFVLGSTPSWLATDTSVPNYTNAPGRTRCRRV